MDRRVVVFVGHSVSAMIGVLAAAAASTVSETTVPLAPGDVMVLYTDGVTEARRNGAFFGEERLQAAII